MPVFSTGPLELEPDVLQLRIKAVNNSNTTAAVTATIFELGGGKSIYATRSINLQPNASGFAVVNIPDLTEFEAEFHTSNPGVLVALFGARSDGSLSLLNSVRSNEMIEI